MKYCSRLSIFLSMMTRSKRSSLLRSFLARSSWKGVMKETEKSSSWAVCSAISIRFEIATSSSRVSRGT